jgi:hypothetical protein
VLATIRNLGRLPCPRCLVPLSKVHRLGTLADMQQRRDNHRRWDHEHEYNLNKARDHIYQRNMQVNSGAVEALLSQESFVPTVVVFLKVHNVLGFLPVAIECISSTPLPLWIRHIQDTGCGFTA